MTEFFNSFVETPPSRTIDLYTKVDREEFLERYLECIRPLHL